MAQEMAPGEDFPMHRRAFLAVSAGSLLAGFARIDASTDARSNMMSNVRADSGYLDVNGLHMYYESHGEGGSAPLVLLHGAFSATQTSFGAVLPGLAAGRRVISLEMQGHGRTADIDRPLRLERMADDVGAALDALDLAQADLFGYSMGATIALRTTLQHPAKVRKLIFMSGFYRLDGIQPGLMEGLAQADPSMMRGTPYYEEYISIAPHPQDFDRLWAKKTDMDRSTRDISDAVISTLRQPVLLISGDNDLPTLEHMTQFYRLLGGGRFGDMPPGLPQSQLAILPGTSHIGASHQGELLLTMIPAFLDGRDRSGPNSS